MGQRERIVRNAESPISSATPTHLRAAEALPQSEQGGSNGLLSLFQRKGRPRIMTTDRAKAQGLFIPNWWITILLIPLAGGILWVIITLTNIQASQTAMKDTLEFRLKTVETQAKLNDEHERQYQLDQARMQGEIDAMNKVMALTVTKKGIN